MGSGPVSESDTASARIAIRFQPVGRIIHVDPGTTLFDAAKSLGLPVASACDAEGACGACGFEILEGQEALSAVTAPERETLKANRVPRTHRLSCLARITGPVTARASYW